MAKKTPKPRDMNQMATAIVGEATNFPENESPEIVKVMLAVDHRTEFGEILRRRLGLTSDSNSQSPRPN